MRKRKLLCCIIFIVIAFSFTAFGDSSDADTPHGLEGWIESKIGNLHTIWLFVIIAITLTALMVWVDAHAQIAFEAARGGN